MSLDDRIDFGTQQIETIPGEGFCLALTEPNGGDIRIGISVERGEDYRDVPRKIVAIACDAPRAREIAAALIELAEVVEANG